MRKINTGKLKFDNHQFRGNCPKNILIVILIKRVSKFKKIINKLKPFECNLKKKNHFEICDFTFITIYKFPIANISCHLKRERKRGIERKMNKHLEIQGREKIKGKRKYHLYPILLITPV